MSQPMKPSDNEPEPLYPQGPASDTGGVVPFPIQGRFSHVRQRLAGGFTDEDRAWRKKWLDDQILHPDEPVVPPNYDKERYNILRRWGRIPMDFAFKPIKPALGKYYDFVRHISGRAMMGVCVVYYFWYYSKYNTGTWESRSGWRAYVNTGAVYPGHPEYPKVSQKTKPSDYFVQMPADLPIKPSTPV